MSELKLELNDFEIVALHEILTQIKDKIVGTSEDWTEMYQTTLQKTISQIRLHHNRSLTSD